MDCSGTVTLGWDDAPDVGGFRLLRLCTSNAAAVAIVEASDAAWERTTPTALASLLRLVSDGLQHLGVVLPLDALVVPANVIPGGASAPPEDARERVTRWSRDQDWHRGDFVLHWCSSAEDAEAETRRLLVLIEALRDHPVTLAPASERSFRRNVSALVREPDIPETRAQLVHAALKELDGPRGAGAIAAWAGDVTSAAREAALVAAVPDTDDDPPEEIEKELGDGQA